MKRTQGLTLVEVLVVVLVVLLAVVVLCGLIPGVFTRAREQSRRVACACNLGNLIKCCHLYSDAVTNQGMFPMYGSDPDANGLKSLNLLYDAYAKDHRVFSCPSSPTPTSLIPAFTGQQETMTAWMTHPLTNYGYDPGHTPAHAKAGIVADFSDDPTKNSANHGINRPGQNVAIGAGSVEWMESPDGIYTDKDDKGLPDELRTFIIQ